MKSIVRLKLYVLASACLTCFVPFCATEPFFSSKANITPVKLFHISPRNTSTITRKDDSAFGTRAKISRVVPIKHLPKMGHSSLKNTSNPSIIKTGSSNSKGAKKNPSMRMGNVPLIQAHFKSPAKNRSTNLNKSTSTTEIPPVINTIGTTLPPNSNKSSNRNPLFLTSDSWNYLNSAVTDDELRQIINGLSTEVIKNVSDLSKHDPIAGQNYLLKSIISEVGNLKRSRMLALDSEKKVAPVNKGVRFSAKQRKPVLNVTPLEQKVNLGKPIKNLIKTGVAEQWNISGVISNDEKSSKKQTPLDTTTSDMRNPELEKYSNGSLTTFKASPIHPGSTTPSLMQVLAVPDQVSLDSTTFSPSYSNQAKHGFVPSIPISNLVSSNTAKPLIYQDKVIPEEPLEKSKRIIEDDDSTMTASKPRVQPKDDEYLLPPITSTSTTVPEANKGYQTISESTTEGPRVIWYHHNQTPQDTFYPNANNFLVPPEESSIEILTDLLPLQQPIHDDKPNTETSFSPAPSEINFKYDSRSGKHKGTKKISPLLHYGSKEDNDIGTRGGGSRLSIEKDNKKRNKIFTLQQAATSDHDGIRDYYGDLDGKNGGSSGEIAYHHYDHYKSKRYGPASYNGYTNDIRHHEIIPRHHKTNRKPPPHSEDDTESYGAFNEDDHYHSSYPPPPDFTRHEIGIERYRSNHPESTGDNDYYKQEPIRTYVSSNGRFRDDEPTTTTDLDIYFKKEPSYRPKDNSPALRPYHGGHGGGNHGHEHDHGHHGWKDPSKDFFSKAKDYFKNSDFSTAEKWFDATIGILAFLAFGGYIIMLLYQVFAVSSGTSIGTLLGRSMRGAGEIFDLFFSKGPIGQAYLDELETIVKRAMANVKRIWMTNSFAEKSSPKVKGDVDAK